MPPEQDEFELLVDQDPDRQFARDVQRSKARVANLITILLVVGLILQPVLYIIAACWRNEATDTLGSFYEKWFALIGPLAGAAVGFYFGREAK